MKQVSVDIGGTFTDCFLVWDDIYLETKALTTHHNLALGFMDALEQACNELGKDIRTVLSQLDSVRYATTLGTNALIERKGPKIGLLTTAGYESQVPLSRGRGYGDGLTPLEQQDLPAARRPEPIVPIPMIAGVRERIDYKGEIVMPLDEEHLRKQIRLLVDRGAQAFVIGLMNSVVNPVHERRVEEIILEEYPTHMLGAIPVILSHQVAERKGEYVRITSAILDAYLHDQMYHALSSLEMTLKEYGYNKPMLVVHNIGGMAQLNSTHALQTIHSGPTAGINAAEHLSEEFEVGHLVAMDMGGTSCDIGIVVGGGIRFYDFNPVIDRWLVSVPMLHLGIIGAGGGSIARYDKTLKHIEVGPASAGSDPGPACFDRGGTNPTVTDADLILGYLDPGYYAEGHISLNKKRAEFAIREAICEELDIDVVEAARQIKKKVDTNMAHAIFKELGVKGYDPKNFTLLAYGGNGPLHCCGIAKVLEMEKILIPPFSPIFSAVGAGIMNLVNIHEKSVFMNIYDSNTRSLFSEFDCFNQYVKELEEAGKEELLRQGIPAEAIQHRLELDMRYGNQLTQTSVISPVNRLNNMSDVLQLVEAFSVNYGERFGEGSQQPEAGIRINTIRVLSYVELDRVKFKKPVEGPAKTPKPHSQRKCYFVDIEGPVLTNVYRTQTIEPGSVIEGPALVESPRTTYLIELGWKLVMGEQNSAWIVRTRKDSLGEKMELESLSKN
ncbi:hydantoinase/oxoprolinase family protein [Saccharococcus thermophilus]|uniref:N-methylhydantoinase A n=1 Tax=Saccharococcus thermophilus TaxID=29396 RepID=A0A846MIX8_9BACL|nr:hydantoinase/oxoprolinase family protein [Saccharococcus thermophilus]NIK15580.1 N-methylhydantoinase A [Saccharococcus thermophilus]